MRGLLFDIDGVLFWQGRLLPGAAEVLLWAQQQGIPYRLITNRVSASAGQMAAELNDSGLAAAGVVLTAEQILTPTEIALEHMRSSAVRAWQVLVPAAQAPAFAELACHDWGAAKGLVLADIGDGWTYETLNQCLQFLLANPQAPWLVLGLTRYFVDGQGAARLDIGAFVKALEYASGREAGVMGKPGAAVFEVACARLGCEPAQCLMLGDDWLTDIRAAQACGIAGVLLRSGKYQPGDEHNCPTAVVMDVLSELPAWWSASSGSWPEVSIPDRKDSPVRGSDLE